MTRWLATLALLLATASPAAAVSIQDLRLWSSCLGAPLATTQPVARGCLADTLFVAALVGPFPAPTPVEIHFALTLDGVLAGSRMTLLPADLGPVAGGSCSACPMGADGVPHYHTAGVGWALPLPREGAGVVVDALVTLEVVGGSLVELPFQMLEPTPEPSTLFLLGTALVGLGWVAKRRRGR